MNKKVLIAVVMFLFPIFAYAASPISITLSKGINPNYHWPEQTVKMIAITDKTEIKDIVVNRGNCRVDKKYVNTGRNIFPKELKYGESVTIFIQPSCTVLQIDVMTNQGNWKMNYQ